MANRPSPGSLVWWRFKSADLRYNFGYCTYLNGPDMVRMGAYNGDTTGGSVVKASEIEWEPYRP